jgi:hypothetical protein
MWSHYASGHQGIVLGMEIPQHWKVHQVNYGTERVPVNLGWGESDRSYQEMLVKLVKSKSQDWAYEREWRAISELKKAEKQMRDGKTQYFVSIGPEIVKTIILGLRFPERYLGTIQALCRHKYPQSRLLQAALHENQFTLVMKEAPVNL